MANFADRVLQILSNCHSGLTSDQIAERLGTTTGKVSSPLSKLAAYGLIRRLWIETGANARRKPVYGLPEKKGASQKREDVSVMRW